MFLTTRGRYAVMAMLDMYDGCLEGKIISIKSMAERQNLSVYYLEQLFSMLKKSGLVTSVKGPGGGYKFAKMPNEIYIVDILQSVGENIKITKCHADAEKNLCIQRKNDIRCNTHGLWADFGKYIKKYFSETTLMDVKYGNFYFQKNQNTII